MARDNQFDRWLNYSELKDSSSGKKIDKILNEREWIVKEILIKNKKKWILSIAELLKKELFLSHNQLKAFFEDHLSELIAKDDSNIQKSIDNYFNK